MVLQNLPTPAKIGIGWVVAISLGLYGFYLSKQHIDKTRYESMKVRERLRALSKEEFTPSRTEEVPPKTNN